MLITRDRGRLLPPMRNDVRQAFPMEPLINYQDAVIARVARLS